MVKGGRIAAAIALLVASVAGTGESVAQHGRMVDIRGWQVGPYYDEQGLYSCDALYDYGNGMLGFGANIYGIWISLHDPDWRIADAFDVPVMVELGSERFTLRGDIFRASQAMMIQADFNGQLWDALKRAPTIKIHSAEMSWEAGLIGSRAAAEGVEGCIDRYAD